MTSQITDPTNFDIQSAFSDLLKIVQLRAEDTEESTRRLNWDSARLFQAGMGKQLER
jgi:hypothetical protein